MSEPASGLAGELVRLVDQAGAAIMALYGRAEARLKPDRTPVTDADETAEAIILAGLARLEPGTPAIAEEAASRGECRLGDDAAPGPGRRFWLVDPLDGTREFLKGNGEFTVNVALVENGAPVLGIVAAPAKDLLYLADGDGARRRRGRAALEPVAPRAAPAGGLVVAHSRSHLDEDTRAYLETIPVAGWRIGGSSLKFCLLAQGGADVYPRFGRTMEWDTAAGHAVLRRAGGSVRTLDGAELRYGKAGHVNPSFVARGGEG